MNVLIIGSGGREHALAWKISQSSMVTNVYVAPGNAGIAEDANIISIDPMNFDQVLHCVNDYKIDYTIVGPEAPLAGGLVDFLMSKGCKVFGPAQKAAQIESSKIFAKNLMKKYGIPTANYFVAQSIQEAVEYINSQPEGPIVVKADGLAAGKGVVVADDRKSAITAVEEMMGQKKFGEAGTQVVIEEKLEGPEASIFVLTDGENYVVLPASQDHKPVGEGDTGPNTGGMGAYAPAPLVTEKMMAKIESEIIEPTLTALRKENASFAGCLYCGLMITKDGPKVIEFNARFGDPETQAVLTLIENDLFLILKQIADGKLEFSSVRIKNESSICVVLVSGGYPGSYKKGYEISGLDEIKKIGNAKIFHAGTTVQDNKIVTNGGRVLNLVVNADSLANARRMAYQLIEKISFKDMYYRRDIGVKGLSDQG
ncbi:MAG: phosphoribosylamine--glycine ligase [Calditrichia bacterium]